MISAADFAFSADCRRQGKSLQLIEMFDQFRNASVIVLQKRDELIAFFRRQPHAGDTEINQHRLSGICANSEVDFKRLLSARGSQFPDRSVSSGSASHHFRSVRADRPNWITSLYSISCLACA